MRSRLEKIARLPSVLVAGALSAGVWGAQGDSVPPAEALEGAFKPQRHFPPYAGRNFPTQVYFGDPHLQERAYTSPIWYTPD